MANGQQVINRQSAVSFGLLCVLIAAVWAMATITTRVRADVDANAGAIVKLEGCVVDVNKRLEEVGKSLYRLELEAGTLPE